MAEGRRKQSSILSFLSPKISSPESSEDDEIIIQPKNRLQGSTTFSKISPKIATPESSKDLNGSPVFPSDVHTQISIEPTTSRESHPKAVVDSTENVYSVDPNSSSSRSSMASSNLLDTDEIQESVDPSTTHTKECADQNVISEDLQLHEVTSNTIPIKKCAGQEVKRECGLTKDTAVDLSTFNPGPQESPICTISRIDLYQRDFNILNAGNWLNCKLMEAYMGLLIQHSKQNGTNVKLFTSHLLAKYNEKGFDCVKQSIVKDDIFEYNIIVALDNTSKAHWTLLYMNFDMQVLMHLDPYSGRLSKSIVDHFREFISACHMALHENKFNWTGWYYCGSKDKSLPLQKGSDDCGVMTLSYAKFLLCDKEVFKVHNGTYRQLISEELRSKKLIIVKQDVESSDPDVNREGLSDSDSDCLPSYTSPIERYARGLSSKKISRRNVVVKLLLDGERGAFAAQHFRQGDFVCEYAATVIHKEQSENDQDRYREAGLGCYCLDAKYQGQWYTFDATLTLRDPGRYINHASSHCNLALMHPIMIGRGTNQRLRIGFLAKQTIHPGEQLFFDYGYRDQPWMVSDARKCTLTVSKGKSSIGQVKKVSPDEAEASAEQSADIQTNEQADRSQTGIQMRETTEEKPKKKPTTCRTRRDCPFETCTSRNLKSISDHLKMVHHVWDRTERLLLCQKAKDIYLKNQKEQHQVDTGKKVIKSVQPTRKDPIKRRKAAFVSSSETESDDEQLKVQKWSPQKRRRVKGLVSSKMHTDLQDTSVSSEDSLPELPETPLAERYHFLKKRNPITFNMEGFIAYLQTLDGGNKGFEPAKAIAAHARGYFEYTPETTPAYMAILNFKSLQNYFTHLQKTMKFSATTIAEKLRSLRHAIDYIMFEHSEEGSMQTTLKCQEIKDRLKKWGGALTKDIKKQRTQNSLKSNYEVTTADSPGDFLTSPAVLSSVMDIMQRAKSRKLIWTEIRVVLTYLAANIIYFNGQRPGVVQKMTTDEWGARVYDDQEDQYVINVMEHKTTGAFGPAKIAISPDIESLMGQYYADIRGKITPQNRVYETRFFLTNTGNEFNKISERMREVAESFGTSVPTSGLQRKVVATEAYKSEDNVVVRGLQKHMCHSAATCERFYQQHNIKSAITAKKTIEKLTLQRFFTLGETNAILSEYPLTEETTPSLAMCEIISTKHHINKTKKQIQDHWRTCKKTHKTV